MSGPVADRDRMAGTNTLYVVDKPCKEGPCRIVEMHHVDVGGKHWCPTGFLWCAEHGEVVGHADGPGLCALWGEKEAS